MNSCRGGEETEQREEIGDAGVLHAALREYHGLRVLFTVEAFDSPIGELLLVSDGVALRMLDLHGNQDELRVMLDKSYGCRIERGSVPREISGALKAYFDGDLTAIERIAVEADGSDFQRRVWAELRAIPAGTTTSYGALARRLGKPGASRAVGLANGANPVAIVVPCHRVIGSDGTLTGYGARRRQRSARAFDLALQRSTLS
jgi:methylated-DNA-[protein]-cysteine S-methyltransferase